jgi:hypothetical protein
MSIDPERLISGWPMTRLSLSPAAKVSAAARLNAKARLEVSSTWRTSPLSRLVLIALALLALASPIATHVWRRAIWASCGETLRDHAALLRKRALFGLWAGRVGYLGGPVGLAIGAWLGLVIDGASSDVDTAAAGSMLIPAVAIFIAAIAWSLHETRRSRRMLEALDALDAQGQGEPARQA